MGDRAQKYDKAEKIMSEGTQPRGGQKAANRRRAAATVSLAVGGLLLAPAAPAFADTDQASGAECTVSTAEVRWGLKQSFRNYISGSIANGEWTTENGASYETPNFVWGGGAGAFSADLESGSVSVSGDVHFTGHGGAMKLDISEPEIEFTGDGSAQLILAVGSTDVEGAEPTYERVSVAKVTLAGNTEAEGDALNITDAPVRLTAEGAAALNGAYGSYVSGEEMDPLSLAVTTEGCELSGDVSIPAEPAEDTAEDSGATDTVAPSPAPEEEPASLPWLPIGIGAVALIAIAVTTGMLIAGGRKGRSATGTDAGARDAGDDTP